MIDRALLTLRTVRHLRWQQLAYRPWRRLQRRLPVRHRPTPWTLSAHAARLGQAIRQRPPETVSGARAEQVAAGCFDLPGASLQLDTVDWTRRYHTHLWNYHLHYFDYALDLAHAWQHTGEERYAQAFERLAGEWIAQSRDRRGDGWDPYPVATRVPNWLHALAVCAEALPAAARTRILNSAHEQLLHLERRLERELLANHLQRNLYALAIGGLYFESSAAARWRGRRTAELWQELAEQVLADGGHYERSPMYHALALRDFLDVLELRRACGEPVPADIAPRLAAMASALRRLVHADGELHLFNDSAHGVAPGSHWLLGWAERALGPLPPAKPGEWALPDTGYYGWRNPAGDERFIIDCGPLGPAYNPAHGHCDLLAFELDLGGVPLCVDAGVCGYDGDPLRPYVRSTAAHNTVLIDGREQSELWGTFRAARRGEPLYARQHGSGERYRFEGAARPYWGAEIRHERAVTRAAGAWAVTDRVCGARDRPLASLLHFHPDCRIEPRAGAATVRGAGGLVFLEWFGVDDVAWHLPGAGATRHWHCPRFGHAVPAPAVEFRVHANAEREFGYRLTPRQP